MKHLKPFKNIKKNKYNINDYVKLKLIPNYVQNIKITENILLTQIIDIEFFDDSNPINDLQIYSFKTYDNKIIYGYDSLIERKLTKKEIETYNMLIHIDKYNL